MINLLRPFVGFVSKKCFDVSNTLRSIFKYIDCWRGRITLYIDGECIELKSYDEIDNLQIKTNVCILSKDIYLDGSFAYTYDGKIYDVKRMESLKGIFESKSVDVNVVKNVLRMLDGFYSLVAVTDEYLLLARDPIGTRPIYYTFKNGSELIFSTSRKILLSIHPSKINLLNPGFSTLLSPSDFQLFEFENLKRMYEHAKMLHQDIDQIVDLLINRMMASLERMVDEKKVCIAFSGGLDSSILAKLSLDLGMDVTLLSIGLHSSKDIGIARNVASMLGMDIVEYGFTIDDLILELPKVFDIIDTRSLLDLSIATSFYFILKKAKDLGFKAVLSGQGADELFGGYKRYERTLKMKGYKVLEQELLSDLINIHATNLERDYDVSLALSMELIYPYLDMDIVKLTLGIPPELKVKEDYPQYCRKYILRLVARALNMPNEVVLSDKRAIQYGTGVWKAIKKILKDGKLDLNVVS